MDRSAEVLFLSKNDCPNLSVSIGRRRNAKEAKQMDTARNLHQEQSDEAYNAMHKMVGDFTPKQIATHLICVDGIWAKRWREDTEIETGMKRISSCMNPNGKEFFLSSELIAITNFTGNDDYFAFQAMCIGRTLSKQLTLEEEIAQVRDIVKKHENHVVESKQLVRRLEAKFAASKLAKPHTRKPHTDAATRFSSEE